MLIQFCQQYHRIAMLYSYQMFRVGFERKFWWNRNICPKTVTYAGLICGGESHSGVLFKICQISK